MDARLSYRQNAVEGASPLGLVVLLYEQAIEDLRRAAIALEAGRIEDRTNAVNHALLVIGHLQSSLDFERGGRSANLLQQFYNHLRSWLCLAQAEQSPQKLRELIDALVLVKGAWLQAEHGEQNLPAGPEEKESPQPAPRVLTWRA